MESSHPHLSAKGLDRSYWTYLLAVGLIAAGYVDFALIAFHFGKVSLMPVIWIPFIYALAMAVDGLASIVIGRLFDRKGWIVLPIATFFTAFFAPFAFLGGLSGAITGMILWGIGLGTQQSVMRGLVAKLVAPNHRGAAYGWLNMSFGLFWFIGSTIMGLLYDLSPLYLVLFSVLTQLASIPFLLSIRKS